MKNLINESGLDRIIRVIAGLALIFVWLTGLVPGGWGLALGLFGFVPLLTGAFGFCPLYALLKFRTNKQ